MRILSERLKVAGGAPSYVNPSVSSLPIDVECFLSMLPAK